MYINNIVYWYEAYLSVILEDLRILAFYVETFLKTRTYFT